MSQPPWAGRLRALASPSRGRTGCAQVRHTTAARMHAVAEVAAEAVHRLEDHPWAADTLAAHPAAKAPQAGRPAADPRQRAGMPGLVVMLGLLAACGHAGDDDGLRAYFPLAAGRNWTYEVLTTVGDAPTPSRETLTLEALGERPIAGLPDGAERAWLRRSSDGIDYWLLAGPEGIRRVASKHDLQGQAEADAPGRWVLKAPLAVGTQWEASTVPYLLARRAEFPPEIRHTHRPVVMRWRIAALDEPVEVPAGRFEHCLRIEGEATIRLFADPVNGFRDMPLATTEWYCRGVGLAKLERREPVDNATFLQGGTLQMRLVERS